jgi:hypothetical protein
MAAPIDVEKPIPWRDVGYRGFSEWMASSNDFFLVRRFGALNARVLLLLQDRIVQKEGELKDLDDDAGVNNLTGPEALSNSIRDDPNDERETLLQEIKSMLDEYSEAESQRLCTWLTDNPDDCIIKLSTIYSWDPATKSQRNNVLNWFYNNERAVVTDEQQWIRVAGDVIPLARQTKSPLRGLLETISRTTGWRMFKLKDQATTRESSTTFNHDINALERFTNAVLITLGLLLLIGPMWSLQFITNEVKRLAIITSFILLFASILAGATAAKPFETLGATAA